MTFDKYLDNVLNLASVFRKLLCCCVELTQKLIQITRLMLNKYLQHMKCQKPIKIMLLDMKDTKNNHLIGGNMVVI